MQTLQSQRWEESYGSMAGGEGIKTTRASSIDFINVFPVLKLWNPFQKLSRLVALYLPTFYPLLQLLSLLSCLTWLGLHDYRSVQIQIYICAYNRNRRGLELIMLCVWRPLFFSFPSASFSPLWPGRPSAWASTAASLLFSPSPSLSPVSHADNRILKCFMSCWAQHGLFCVTSGTFAFNLRLWAYQKLRSALSGVVLMRFENVWPMVRIYRGGFLLIQFIFLLGINTYGWRQAGVNHVLIFEINPRNNLSHQHLFEVRLRNTCFKPHQCPENQTFHLRCSCLHAALLRLFADRWVPGCAVVPQHPLLPVLGVRLHPHADQPPDPLRLHDALPHQPHQNLLLQISFLAPQAAGQSSTALLKRSPTVSGSRIDLVGGWI